MFDIAKALKATVDVHKDRARRVHLAGFLMRLTRQDGLVTGWRTVGRDAEVVKCFLDGLGFTEADYTLYESVLDPSVHDFRWTATGRYGQLTAQARTPYSTSAIREMVHSIVGFDGNEDTVISGYELGDDAVGGEARPAASFSIEETTRGRFDEFIAKATADDAASPEVVRIREFLRMAPQDCAVPNLSVIECIARYLNPDMRFVMPPLFEGACIDVPQKKTVIRHFDENTRFPAQFVLSSTVIPFEYDLSIPGIDEGDDAPLEGFFYRTAEDAKKANVGNLPVFISAFEELSPGKQGTALVRATDLPLLWSYISQLYNTFFRSVSAVCSSSRLMIGNDSPEFMSHDGLDREALSRAMREHGFASEGSDVGVSVQLVLTGPGCRYSPPTIDYVTNTVRFTRYRLASENGSVNTASFELTRVSAGDMPTEWYSIVHHNGRDSVGSPNSGGMYCNGATMARAVDRLRRRATVQMMRHTLVNSVNAGVNPDLDCSKHANGNSYYATPCDAMVSGVSAAVRISTGAIANGTAPTTAPWPRPDDQYAAAHSATTLVSAVYSGVFGDGSYIRRMVDAADPAEFTDLVSALIVHQRDPVTYETPGYDTRAIVYETNITAPLDAAQELDLEKRVHRLATACFIGGYAQPAAVMDAMPDGRRLDGFPNNVPPRERFNSQDFSRGYYQRSDFYGKNGWQTLVRKLAYIGISGFGYDSNGAEPNIDLNDMTNGISVVIRRDEANRLYVIVTFSRKATLHALMKFRYRKGLPMLDAWTRASIPDGSEDSIVGRPRDGVARTEREIVDETITRLMEHDSATDFGSIGLTDQRLYGIGPWFKDRRRDSTLPLSRDDFRSIIDASWCPWNDGLV